MFTVFSIDEDRDYLALRHAASPVTIVVKAWGEGQFEALYGMKRDPATGSWERQEIPSCFTLSDDSIAALRAYENDDPVTDENGDAWKRARDYRPGDLF